MVATPKRNGMRVLVSVRCKVASTKRRSAGVIGFQLSGLDGHFTIRIVAISTKSTQITVRNTQSIDAAVDFSPLELDPAFPLEVILTGERDDTPITNLHVHDGLEIGCCLEGSGILYVGAKILPFRQGDVTVITDREFHRCRSSPGTRSRWAWFFVNPPTLLVPHATPILTWEPERFYGQAFSNVISPITHPRIAQLVSPLIGEARQSDAAVRANLRALLLLLVNELHRLFPKPQEVSAFDHGAETLTRITPALQQIVSYFDSPITIPDLAHSCGMSVRNFQLQFTKLMGITPQGHLLNSRIQAAAAALLVDHQRAITDVAFSCGFNTLSSFNRAFKTIFHCSPRAYRKKMALH